MFSEGGRANADDQSTDPEKETKGRRKIDDAGIKRESPEAGRVHRG
jgi:hypothetical protein